MPRDFTFLKALPGEIDKVGFEIEDEARKLIMEDIPKLRQRKTEMATAVRAEIDRQREAIEQAHMGIDRVITAVGGNSGEKNPTSQG